MQTTTPINIAIMGIGTVGGGTYDILTRERAMILKTQGIDIRVAKVLDRSVDLIVKRGVPAECATTSLEDILADNSISIVVETMGGVEPAKTFITRILESGRSVVTANKELIAKHGKELEPIAKKTGAGLYFEASCAGGIPIIRVLQQGMQANNLTQIFGIINGTTNYILTKMAESKLSYGTALSDAQALGFAEFDPTADVGGHDAAYKLSILLTLAFHTHIPYTEIFREGITAVTAADIANAAKLGYVIKLLAIGKREKGKLEARVHPCFVPLSHPLSSVRNEFNAVFLKGDSVDDVMLYGRGAGSFPTASAVVSDIAVCAKSAAHTYTAFSAPRHLINAAGSAGEQTVGDGSSGAPQSALAPAGTVSDFESAYYLALTAEDRAGVLAGIADLFGRFGISIAQMVQSEASNGTASIIFLTHATSEKAMQDALSEMKKLKAVKSADSVIRVL